MKKGLFLAGYDDAEELLPPMSPITVPLVSKDDIEFAEIIDDISAYMVNFLGTLYGRAELLAKARTEKAFRESIFEFDIFVPANPFIPEDLEEKADVLIAYLRTTAGMDEFKTRMNSDDTFVHYIYSFSGFYLLEGESVEDTVQSSVFMTPYLEATLARTNSDPDLDASSCESSLELHADNGWYAPITLRPVSKL